MSEVPGYCGDGPRSPLSSNRGAACGGIEASAIKEWTWEDNFGHQLGNEAILN